MNRAKSRPSKSPRPSPPKSRGKPSSQPQRHGLPGKSDPRRAPALPDRNLSADSKLRWVIGLHAVRECLKVRPRAIREFWLRENFEDSQALRDLHELAQSFKLRVSVKPSAHIEKLGSVPQGVAVGLAETPELDWQALKEKESALILILDGIEDPQNLGSILRSAWLMGVSGVIVPRDRSVQLTPTASKVASGGAEHVPVEAVTQLPQAISDLKDAGFWIYGLAESGTRLPWDFKLGKKVAWIVGSEGEGLRITTERSCDELVRIPQVASGSSFNAAVTAAMALYESVRQNPQVVKETVSNLEI